MRKWVVCRVGVSKYRSTAHDPAGDEGWVDGSELQRVRTWDDREKAEDYLMTLGVLYPQLGDLNVVKVLVWKQAGIIGVMEG